MDQPTGRRNHGEAVAHAAIAARPRLSNVLVLLEEGEQRGDEPTAPFVGGHGMLRDHLAVLGEDDLERQAIAASLDNFGSRRRGLGHCQELPLPSYVRLSGK